MSDKKPSQVAEQLMRRWNSRIPKTLDAEDAILPKKLRKPRYAEFEALQEIYKLLDRFYAFCSGLTPCQKGCSYCCHSEIAVSKVEADYIASVTGVQLAMPTRFLLRRSVNYCDPAKPCPFLAADGGCSIYPCRPMLCRTHVSFETDNAKCKFDSPEETVFFVDRAKSFPGAMRAYLDLVERHYPGGGFADIREYFGTTKRALPIGACSDQH